jgi:hypothetical protein
MFLNRGLETLILLGTQQKKPEAVSGLDFKEFLRPLLVTF